MKNVGNVLDVSFFCIVFFLLILKLYPLKAHLNKFVRMNKKRIFNKSHCIVMIQMSKNHFRFKFIFFVFDDDYKKMSNTL